MSKENLLVVFAVILLLLSLEAMIFLSFPVTREVEKKVYVTPGTGMVDQCSQKWWPETGPEGRKN